jgi:hypothetical protein
LDTINGWRRWETEKGGKVGGKGEREGEGEGEKMDGWIGSQTHIVCPKLCIHVCTRKQSLVNEKKSVKTEVGLFSRNEVQKGEKGGKGKKRIHLFPKLTRLVRKLKFLT